MNELSEQSVSPRSAGEADGYNSVWHEVWNQDQYEFESDRQHYDEGWRDGYKRGTEARNRLASLEARLGMGRPEPAQRMVAPSFTASTRPPGAMKIQQAKRQDYFRKTTGSKVKNRRLFGRST